MVRLGGLSYRIAVDAPMGQRISDLVYLATGEALDLERSYTVAGWASTTEGTEGPQIWDVVENHIRAKTRISAGENTTIKIATD